ncbi:hypothetical protein [Acidovorax sp. NCPPB 3576]|uniref:hypothetical protein n=1 Tax=Acidovorax sp. NCPPB 3576 TaxID=2940488 RepID=UPI00234BB230|nr:hypothetical protein [Acidovorax sp. NCPPB 3576]WCM88112.1 hypothetical protein M5C98_22695 [Acidovorax sp. NCPPB 3576]
MPVQDIRVIHTLGPAGTNCEAAAHEWFKRNGRKGAVHLHPTLEIAAEELKDDPAIALLGCVAYPDLHTLVFSNLSRFQMVDIFVMPTFNMILASRTGEPPQTISTHPAPQRLAPPGAQLSLVNSNAQAAVDCRHGKTEGCITTAKAAQSLGLKVVQDFGPVPMGFTVHAAA